MAMLLLVLLLAQHSSTQWTSNIQNYVILAPVQDIVSVHSECYTPPAPLLFMSTATSYNQSRASMVTMCAAQNGIPLIIRTTQQRDQAKNLVRSSGVGNILFGWYAFLSARDVHAAEDPIRPDGTKVVGSVSTKSNIQIETKYEIATMLRNDGNIFITKEMNPNELPSLCEKYP
ncbi:uncharacterized protein LOC108682742 [Hyalella azteca]|uniref:Uncharacterized protein LOC108682742 n=1 Tax=Hyalella azteca TaxID=294128 RepID=A0A8B7PMP9_HYAAZ|nr:uncharacterized protein LOC108682742 [Hyalella azteca]